MEKKQLELTEEATIQLADIKQICFWEHLLGCHKKNAKLP